MGQVFPIGEPGSDPNIFPATFFRSEDDLPTDVKVSSLDSAVATGDPIPYVNKGFEATAIINAPRGMIYTFYVQADDEVRLYIDGKLAVEAKCSQAECPVKREVTAELSPGLHRLNIVWLNLEGDGLIGFDTRHQEILEWQE